MLLDPTLRFTDRAADYARHRPTYPTAIVEWLRSDHGMQPSWLVADVGAGTGLSSRVFLEAGHSVAAVEPNDAMRAMADAALGRHPGFRIIAGRAEATTLPDCSVDLIWSAQAFHWFDPTATRVEWRRILRPGGLAVICWNVRRAVGTPFLEGYERLLQEYTNRARDVLADVDEEAACRWFGAGLREVRSFENPLALDLEALQGGLLSASYAPKRGQPGCAEMLEAARRLFEEHAIGGRVTLELDARAYVGQLRA